MEEILENIHQDLIYAVSNREDGNLSCRYGDAQEVISDREKFLDKLGLTLDDCVMMNLDHVDTVRRVGRDDLGQAMRCGEDSETADALVTNEPGVNLFFLTADCIPAVLYDPAKKVLAAVHLSWITTDLNLVQKTVVKMGEWFGTEAEDILVYMGPGIQKESYKFEVLKQDENSPWGDFIEKEDDGLYHVDVLGYNKKQLIDVGVKESSIYTSGIDTFQSPKYFSHYRSARSTEEEARFATVVGIKNG